MLKCQFHCHAQGDPIDSINYSPKKLIDEAAKLNFDVLCITCHRKILFTEELKKYAATKNILLIRSIEFEINKKHILGINIDEEILKVDSFAKLKVYRKNHPQSLIIAAHPFFPGKTCLHEDLINNIDLFDAIENSFAYTHLTNFNKKAITTAHKYNKPLVATADCHILSYLNIGYTLVDSEKNIPAVINAIKKDQIKIFTKSTSYLKIFRFFVQIKLQNIITKLLGSKN